MKRRFLFTLALLLTTTCLIAGPVAAYTDNQSGTMFNGAVDGVTYVYTAFSFPTASAGHSCHIWNDAPGSMKLYLTAGAQVYWNGGSDSDSTEDSTFVSGGSSGHLYASHSFNMSEKEQGNAHIYGWTSLRVRNIATNQTEYCPTAMAITYFKLF